MNNVTKSRPSSRSFKLSPSDRRTKNFHHSLFIHNKSIPQPNRNIRKHRNLSESQTSSVLTQHWDPKSSEQSRPKPPQSNSNSLVSRWIRCNSEKRVESGERTSHVSSSDT